MTDNLCGLLIDDSTINMESEVQTSTAATPSRLPAFTLKICEVKVITVDAWPSVSAEYLLRQRHPPDRRSQ